MDKVLKNAIKSVSSPAYIFSEQDFIDRTEMVKSAFGEKTEICFSIKANPFLLSVLPEAFEKIEVCSPGELEICKSLNVNPGKIIFSGVNKSRKEVEIAVEYGVKTLTAESFSHIEYINSVSKEKGVSSDVLVRLSCESQFGMDKNDVLDAIRRRSEYEFINIVGIHYFTGTQKTRPKEIIKELVRLQKFLNLLESDLGFCPERVEYGTGLAIDYFTFDANETEKQRLLEISDSIQELSNKTNLTVEMGRFFAAPCGYYISTVVDTKHNDGVNYAIIDGGLHQLKYDGQIQGMQIPTITHLKDGEIATQLPNGDNKSDSQNWTLCGSLCTTADVIAREALLPKLEIGDILVFHRVGAYSVYEGFSMFLSRDLPSIYILDKSGCLHKVRDRIETAQFNLCKNLI